MEQLATIRGTKLLHPRNKSRLQGNKSVHPWNKSLLQGEQNFINRGINHDYKGTKFCGTETIHDYMGN
jgi:hypothetical protein